MYAHQVLNDYLDYYSDNSNYPKDIKYMICNLRANIVSSIKFHIENIEWLSKTISGRIIYPAEFIKKYKKYIKLPYNKCWFDANLKIYNDYNQNDLCQKFYPASKLGLFAWNDKNTNKICAAPIFGCKETGWQIPSGVGEIDLKQNNIYYRLLNLKEVDKHFKNDKSREPLMDSVTTAMFTLMEMLVLINCKNITTREIAAPTKLNKKRRKTGKGELFKYHILRIKPTKAKSSNGEDVKLKGLKRIHFCRGHFKVRKTGIFWWQPHVRGNKNKGVVMKDYII